MNKVISTMLLSLLVASQPEPELTPEEIDQAEWWRKFKEEIEAIGGTIGDTLTETGSIDIKVPANRRADAARIVKKYATNPNMKVT